MNFASDNAAGVAPPILEAIAAANAGFALAYGRDDVTARVTRRFCDIFEREVAVFLVPTGTAANALALAHLSPPWGAVLCHAESHIITDECGAPEFFGGGLKLIGLPGDGRQDLARRRCSRRSTRGPWGGPHHVSASVLSLTQATEAGTVYRADEIARAVRRWRMRTGSRCIWTARASPTRWRASTASPARGDLEGRRRRALARRHQGAARSPPRRSCSSSPSVPRIWTSGASAAGTSSPSIASSPRSSRRFSPTICG